MVVSTDRGRTATAGRSQRFKWGRPPWAQRSGRWRPTPASAALLAAAVLALVASLVVAAWAAVPGPVGPAGAASAPDQVRAIVVFDESTFGSARMNRELSAAGAGVLKVIHEPRVVVVTLPSRATATALAARAGVERVELDSVVHATGKPTTTTTAAPAQTTPWGITRVGAPTVWAASFTAPANGTGDGVNVAVIDTGIDLDHPDLAGNIEGGYMAIAATGKYRKNRSYNDDNGHGTHVAGIIAAANNGVGVVGVAPQADLYAVKALDQNGSGWTSDIVDGIYWAIGTHSDRDAAGNLTPGNDIRVINMSFGSDYLSTTLASAVRDAYAAGILLVAAAGNDGAAVDYPGSYPEVVAVAATDATDAVPSWSSRGPEVELAAPGVSVYSTYAGGGYKVLSGTSMAAPHVSGSAALVWGAQPELSVADLRTLLAASAEDLGALGRDDLTGAGLVRPDRALNLVGP